MTDIAFNQIDTNGISMRIAEAGSGPLVLLIHGWPESWYSWRHQITALAAAGFHAVAPDMRGYGGTSAPAAAEAYRIDHLAKDVIGIIDHFSQDTATIVGHDWGSMVVWYTALFHPSRINGVMGMSVPYGGRAKLPPLDSFKAAMGDNFFYILYHNEAGGVAEAEYDADPRGILSRLYASPASPRAPAKITDPRRSAGGWIDRLGEVTAQPDWLSTEDLDYFVNEFTRSGFRGGVNYYRNFNSNWEITSELDPVISMPAAFLSGAQDVVIQGADETALRNMMAPVMADLRDITLIDNMGHWIQQEAPEATNAAIIEFLHGLSLS
jgi:pimeloyl-ACP methyl ester carboxylesterase